MSSSSIRPISKHLPNIANQREFGRYFRVTKSWEELRMEGGRKERWLQLDVMSIRKWQQRDVKSVVVKTAQVWRESKMSMRKWQQRDVKSVVVKTAQVWRESKIAHEMLCFTIETAVGGCEGRMCRTGGCGAGAGLGAFHSAMAGVFRGRGWESNVRHIIGECNCRLLDALAGGFRGRGKASNVRHIIGECKCRLLDALAGEFRGRGKERFE